MSEILIFGVCGDKLPEEQRKFIQGCCAVVVSKRHHPLLETIDVHKISIAPVKEMVYSLAVALEKGDVAVLASGDPLFFGIGRTLIGRFGAERVRIFPALSAVRVQQWQSRQSANLNANLNICFIYLPYNRKLAAGAWHTHARFFMMRYDKCAD